MILIRSDPHTAKHIYGFVQPGDYVFDLFSKDTIIRYSNNSRNELTTDKMYHVVSFFEELCNITN